MDRLVLESKVSGLMPKMSVLRESVPAVLRGTGLLCALHAAQKIVRDPSRFGKGAVEGVASMWEGKLMLVIINLPLIGMRILLLRVPYRLIFPATVLFCCISVYTLNNSTFEMFMAAGFRLMGYMLLKFGFEPTPLLLSFVLGPLMEENVRRAMRYSQGDPKVFVERPLSAALLSIAAAPMVLAVLPAVRNKRNDVLTEQAVGLRHAVGACARTAAR